MLMGIELDDIVSAQCESHELIDNALRTYLNFTTKYKGIYIGLEAEYRGWGIDDLSRGIRPHGI